ncbi:MAG: site-specific DNA-methyltransferase [Dysgonamonadaceae bacterium]|jgi:site-specific DNA-methyltransferase (cytosine-N4-specific)|nr:site-specific DNA-methyltransferase [Dysgonamonadaceae bacterium]
MEMNKRSVCDEWRVRDFSAGNFGSQSARMSLERRLIDITVVCDDFNRRSVSYQLSKEESLHRWLKYKEGFSADLVNRLLGEFGIRPGDTVLDPFVGSGTTSLVCKLQNIHSIGLDILPMSGLAIGVKAAVFDYDLAELRRLISDVENLSMPEDYDFRTPCIPITEGAYPERTEREIAFYTVWNQSSGYSRLAKNLVALCILNSLEEVSYTSKDGQFLRWDYRSRKMRELDERRRVSGRTRPVVRLNKGDLPIFGRVLVEALNGILGDIISIRKDFFKTDAGLTFIRGSALYELPKLGANILSGVITSPPYCNRYDYTRTYALELTWLGVGEEGIKDLRQELLSSTVESRPKLDRIRESYIALGREKDFDGILNIVKRNETLAEVNRSLLERNLSGDLNNRGILRMVEGYFMELTFIYAELFRLCRPGAKVAFVNDNVRYGGEVISVDFISTQLAEQVGFKPVKIYSLRQRKGNSSQQMAKFGRVPLRKSITVWEKP